MVAGNVRRATVVAENLLCVCEDIAVTHLK